MLLSIDPKAPGQGHRRGTGPGSPQAGGEQTCPVTGVFRARVALPSQRSVPPGPGLSFPLCAGLVMTKPRGFIRLSGSQKPLSHHPPSPPIPPHMCNANQAGDRASLLFLSPPRASLRVPMLHPCGWEAACQVPPPGHGFCCPAPRGPFSNPVNPRNTSLPCGTNARLTLPSQASTRKDRPACSMAKPHATRGKGHTANMVFPQGSWSGRPGPGTGSSWARLSLAPPQGESWGFVKGGIS